MSQYRKLDKGCGKMAISYASGIPADHVQALPSFRELLPPHLHDEIDSSPYLASARQHSHERPGSASHGQIANPRPVSGQAPYIHPSKFTAGDSPRNHTVNSVRASETHPALVGDHQTAQTRMPEKLPQSTSGSTPPYASCGPSPILPPIRDLHSIPNRSLNTSTAVFPDARGPPLSDPFTLQEFRHEPHNYVPANFSGPIGDRRSAGAYIGSGGPSMQTQSTYSYPGMAYHSDSEQASPQLLPPSQQSNFGILGDPVDSKNKRRRGNLPKPVTEILRAWFHEHLDHPYPSEEDKQMFMTRTGLTISQISNWFINARRRQLPALRNQMRNGTNDLDSQRQYPLSDIDQTSSERIPSPHRP